MDAIVEEADEEEGSDVELEPEPAAPVRPLPGHPPPAEPPEPPSTKRLRHSYSIKTKFKILDCLDKAEAVVKASLAADSPFFHSPVLEGVSRKTGVPISTLKDWVQKRDVIHEKYASKRARRRRRLGSGRLPSFPKAEEAVAKLVNDRRRECRIVSKSFVLKHLKIEAEKEAPEKFAQAKFCPDMVSSFMRRNGFSLRHPSCIRHDDLATAILICRAYHRELLSVLADDGPVHYAKKPLHPSFGRFLLKYRENGDELPYRFGRVKSIVSLAGESLTHITRPPGWEARLATLFLLANALGSITAVAIIFQGSFDKPAKSQLEEVAAYKRKYPGIHVFFQKKALMDGALLTRITQQVYVPHLKDMWAADNVDFAESLLVLDNGPGRGDEKFLGALGTSHTYLLKLPPNQTGYVQMIDDNVGRVFRDLACDVIESEIEALSVDKVAALSVKEKRDLMVKAAHSALATWSSQERYTEIGARAAKRTGLAMRIDDNCAGVSPTRFPPGYPSTIPATSGAPVQSYGMREPAPANPSPPMIVAEIPPSNALLLDAPPGVAVQVSIAPVGAPLAVRVVAPPSRRPGRRTQEEVGIYDGWSDAEERVFLADEVSQSESSSEDEAQAPRRRRWCLPGCDCERPAGSRKCQCERTGASFCGKNCQCDPGLCRARITVEEAD